MPYLPWFCGDLRLLRFRWTFRFPLLDPLLPCFLLWPLFPPLLAPLLLPLLLNSPELLLLASSHLRVHVEILRHEDPEDLVKAADPAEVQRGRVVAHLVPGLEQRIYSLARIGFHLNWESDCLRIQSCNSV